MTIVNIDDLRLAARRRLPKLFFDYIDGGSFAEETYRRNKDDFSLLRLRQHVLVDYAEPDLSTEYLGRRHPLPFMPGPVGLLGRAYAYALAPAGQARVDRAIETLRRVFSITSALMGVSSIADLKKRGSHLNSNSDRERRRKETNTYIRYSPVMTLMGGHQTSEDESCMIR